MYGISYTVGIFVEIYALERDAQLLIDYGLAPWAPPPRLLLTACSLCAVTERKLHTSTTVSTHVNFYFARPSSKPSNSSRPHRTITCVERPR